ncbi:MAG: ABC transporter ATP-binding protein, partial [Candidatus Cloacimonadota bacterium]|nr:ABC transporter ATP-binding protein [Candidatus Cloacimonadota bacterium]
MINTQEAIRLENITKKFGNFTANDSISISINKGETYALLGENGAGKSTLMNVLYGLYQPTSGKIFINEKEIKIKNPNVAIANGVGMTQQHFMLVPPFTVTENIILGLETANKFGILNLKEARKKVVELSEKYGLIVDPDAKVENISVGMQQRVEILKALFRGAEYLILDEPTAVLTPQEIQELTKIVNNLNKEGKSVILISHKLKEIMDMADRCAIIRRGKLIDVVTIANSSEMELASKMVGREVTFKVAKNDKVPLDEILKITDLVVKDDRNLLAVNKLSLSVKAGEILGIAGIDGNGQSELAEALTGLRHVESGNISVNGEDVTNLKPRQLFKKGISHIPEDRQKHGLVLDFSVSYNHILQNYYNHPFAEKSIIQNSEIEQFSNELIETFDIRPKKPNKLAKHLSGGNQQKVIIAREITHNPDVLIAVQPTRGLDVGAIEY